MVLGWVQACERFGRDNIDAIVNAMKDSKSPAEVERYAAIFWERGAEELSGIVQINDGLVY